MATGVSFAPEPVEQMELRFRRMRLVNLTGSKSNTPANVKTPRQALAGSNKFGILFAALPNGFACVDVAHLESFDDEMDQSKRNDVVQEAKSIFIDMPSTPTHLGLNADETVLSVAVVCQGAPRLYFYDVRAFGGSVAPGSIKPFTEAPCNTPPGTAICGCQWNPVLPSMLALVFTNGSMALFMLDLKNDSKTPPDCCTLPPAEGITCISWSPKGKQLVAGKKNGTLTQYKPDLKEFKTIPAPSTANGGPYSAHSILWISTYQFLVAFKDPTDASARAGLLVVQGSKTGPTSYFNYDDICFSTGEKYDTYFCLSHVPEWDIIICGSNNGIEIGVLGPCKDPPGYVQWFLSDTGRPELPLGPSNQERFPIGDAFISTSVRKLPLGENKFRESPAPMSFFMTDDFMLCGFYVLNDASDAKNFNQPPQKLTDSGMRLGTVDIPLAGVKEQTPQSAGQVVGIQPKQSDIGGVFSTSTPAKPELPSFSKASSQPPPPSLFGASVKSSTPIASAPIAIKKDVAAMKDPATPKKAEPPEYKAPISSKAPQEAAISQYRKAIQEEMKSFGDEIKQFKAKFASLDVVIGSAEDKQKLRQSTESMETFCNDLVEITSSQNREISYLQTTTLESFEWAEEARSREQRNRDPKYQRLLKSRALDPLNQKRLSSVTSKHHFLEQQLNEANEKLDSEWRDHLKRTKGHGQTIGRRIEVPSRVKIYQALSINHMILANQKAAIEKIEHHIKSMKVKHVKDGHSGVSFASPLKIAEDLQELTDSFMERTQLDDPAVADTSKTSYAIASAVRPFSPEKEAALRSKLLQRGIVRIKPVIPVSPETSKFLHAESQTKTKVQLLFDQTTENPFPKAAEAQNTKSVPTKPPSSAPEPASVTSQFAAKTQIAGQNASASGFSVASPAAAKSSGLSGFTMPASNSATSSSGKSSLSIVPVPIASSTNSGFSFASTPKPIAEASTNASNSPFASATMLSKPAASVTAAAVASKNIPPSSTSVAATTSSDLPKPNFSFLKSGGQVQQSEVSPASSGATSKPSLFGAVPATQSGGFGASTSTTSSGFSFVTPTKATTAPSVSLSFGSANAPPSSAAAAKPATTVTPATTTSKTPSFGTTTIASSSAESVKTSAPTSTKDSGSTSVSSASGPQKTAPSSSIFGTSTTSTAAIASSGSLFGSTSSPVTTSAPQSIFGGSTPKSGSIFGSSVQVSTAVATTSGSLFGSPTVTATTSSSSIFGAATSSTSASNIFGASKATSPAVTGSIFGAASTSTTPFGTAVASTIAGSSTLPSPASTASSSIFGASSAAPTTTSLFGTATATSSAASTTPSIFGSPAATTTSSVFFTPKTTTTSFGTSQSVFGTTTTTTSAPGGSSSSIFGSASTSASAGFGNATTTTTTSGGSLFGGTTQSNTFGTPATTSSIFGGGSNQSSGFGTPTTATGGSVFGSSGFGATASTQSGSSIFGGTQTASTASSSVFGAAPTGSTTLAPSFGQALSFGSPSATTTSSGNVFGAKSSGGIFGGDNKSTPTTSTTSLFGSSPSTPFGSGTTTSAFGGNQASSPFSSGQATGSPFGAPPNQQVSPSGGFGSAPSFGGAPKFGSSASGFGSSPSFGSAPVFGSGANPQGSTFGATGASQSTFGSLAQANLPTFGSMGQQTGSPSFGNLAQQPQPSFGGGGTTGGSFGSPSSGFGSPRGGQSSAFSSWR